MAASVVGSQEGRRQPADGVLTERLSRQTSAAVLCVGAVVQVQPLLETVVVAAVVILRVPAQLVQMPGRAQVGLPVVLGDQLPGVIGDRRLIPALYWFILRRDRIDRLGKVGVVEVVAGR